MSASETSAPGSPAPVPVAMRTMLFVPGDSPRKFEKAREGPADSLILDLEDSVAPARKVEARTITATMLATPNRRQPLFVRINALDTGLTVDDLAAVMPHRPDGIVLPKSRHGDDVRRVAHYLDAFEAAHGIAPGTTRIVPIVTETADALFTLGSYRDCSPRIWGLMWGAEDLAAALGAGDNRAPSGEHGSPFRLARDLCLAGARAAGVEPIDTVWVDVKNLDGLRDESVTAKRDGFNCKALIHPSHVDVVHAAFAPTPQEIDWATRVMAVIDSAPADGVFVLDGRMVDLPHIRKARSILARASR